MRSGQITSFQLKLTQINQFSVEIFIFIILFLNLLENKNFMRHKGIIQMNL